MLIRVFDRTVNDAEGVIAVDHVTFGDCHYTPEYIVDLLRNSAQRVWVAEVGRKIVGFVSAFDVHTLAADRWEIDELAVLPQFQGRGIGSALIRRALDEAPALPLTRAIVAGQNLASQRALAKNGFSPGKMAELLVRRLDCRTVAAPGTAVRRADGADAALLAGLAGCAVERAAAALDRRENVYLLARRGYIELVRVYTLQYRGLWVESLQAAGGDVRLIRALLQAAVRWGQRMGDVDLIGCLARPDEIAVYTSCVDLGLRPVNEYMTLLKKVGTVEQPVKGLEDA